MAECPHCEELRERIVALEGLLGIGDDVPSRIGLGGAEVDIFAMLMRREVCSKTLLMDAIYGGRPGDAPEDRIIDVYICRMRRKLEPFGINIVTVTRRGWSLPADERAKVYRMLGGENAADREVSIRAGAASVRSRLHNAADVVASVGAP